MSCARKTGRRSSGDAVLDERDTVKLFFPNATYLRVSDNIQQPNDVRSARQVLQNLDLSLDLLLLDRLEHFDDALLVRRQMDRLEHLYISDVAQLVCERSLAVDEGMRDSEGMSRHPPRSTFLVRPCVQSHSCPGLPIVRPSCLLVSVGRPARFMR